MKVFQVSSLITIQLYYEQLVTTTTAGPILQFWHRDCPPQLSPSTAPSHPSLQERSEWQWGEVRGGMELDCSLEHLEHGETATLGAPWIWIWPARHDDIGR
jgi:hypothetical protein